MTKSSVCTDRSDGEVWYTCTAHAPHVRTFWWGFLCNVTSYAGSWPQNPEHRKRLQALCQLPNHAELQALTLRQRSQQAADELLREEEAAAAAAESARQKAQVLLSC